MGSWIALKPISIFLKKNLKGFIGISSAPEFLEEFNVEKI